MLLKVAASPHARRWRRLVRQLETSAGLQIVAQVTHAETIPVPPMPVFPAQEEPLAAYPRGSLRIPPVAIGLALDAQVFGGTNLVLTDRGVVCHAYYNFARDLTSEELHCRAMVDSRQGRIRWLDHDRKPVSVVECATFLDACSANYAHWVSEVLPRIALFCAADRFARVPLLIDDGLHPNLLESLALVSTPGREVILAPRKRCLHVERLYVVSATGYIPFGPRHAGSNATFHGAFSTAALRALRERLMMQAPGERAQPQRRRRLYVRRAAGTRKLINNAAVERMLLRHGFEIVEPERLTFSQQVALFGCAEAVVAATGAACANLIFCPAGTKAAVLMARHRDMPYRYWSAMAGPLGVEVCCILGESEPSHLGIHNDFLVQESDVLDFLRRAGLQ